MPIFDNKSYPKLSLTTRLTQTWCQTNKCPHTMKPGWRKMQSTESLCEVSPLESGNGSIWHLQNFWIFYFSNSTRKVSPNKLLLSEYYLNAQGCDLWLGTLAQSLFCVFPIRKVNTIDSTVRKIVDGFVFVWRLVRLKKKTTIVDAPSVYRQILCPVCVSFS